MTAASVLVTGANGDLGLSIGRILREVMAPGSRIFGSDLAERWPAASVFDDVVNLPRANAAGYIDSLASTVARLDIELVIPASVPEITSLSQNWALASSRLPLLMNEPHHILPFMDKLETFRQLGSAGIEVPLTCDLADASPDDLPLLLKPRFGSGSRSIRVVRNPVALREAQQDATEPTVAQEFIDAPDDEFTCPVVRWAGEHRALVVRRVLDGSLTIRFRVEHVPAIDDLCRRVTEALDLQGVLNIQLRLGPHGPRIFEINPRFSSTVKMRHDIGFCDLAWMVEARTTGRLPAWTPPLAGTRVFRLHRELVVGPGQ